MKMSIHRALAELKLMDKKILSKIQGLNIAGGLRDGIVNNHYKENEFADGVKADYQSINDLIKRKVDIKNAVVKANAETIVSVNGKEMSIAQAIHFRDVIILKKELYTRLERSNASVKSAVDEHNNKIEETAIQLAEKALGKDNVKITDNEAVAITEPYMKKYRVEFIDPLSVEDEIKKLKEEVEGYEIEIDAALSEINAITMIEI
jgi:hypothetical protein